MILNDLNPEFRTAIKYRVDETNTEERLIFQMWDDDAIVGQSTNYNKSDDDLIGEAYCTVAALIHRAQQPDGFRVFRQHLKCPNKPERKNGEIIIEVSIKTVQEQPPQ